MNWDETILFRALQVIRCDPSCANGFAPAELLLGRKLVYPIEINAEEIDFSGTKLTKSLAQKLFEIHAKVFGESSEKITIYQAKYKEQYDRKHKTRPFPLVKGDKVQVKIHKNKRPKSKGGLNWKPYQNFYTIHKILRTKKQVLVKNFHGKLLKRSHPFDRIRLYVGS